MSGKQIDNLLDSLFGDNADASASERRLRDLEGELGVVGGPPPKSSRARLDEGEAEAPSQSEAGRRRDPAVSEVEPDDSPPRVGAPPPRPEAPPAPEPFLQPEALLDPDDLGASAPSWTPSGSVERVRAAHPSDRPASRRTTRSLGLVDDRPSTAPAEPVDAAPVARRRRVTAPPVEVEAVATPRTRRVTGSHEVVDPASSARPRSAGPRSAPPSEGRSNRFSRPRRETASRRALIPDRSDRPARVARPSTAPPSLVNSEDLFADFDDLELGFDPSSAPAPVLPTAPSVVGDMRRVARLLVDMHSIDWRSVDPRAGFLITQVDGATTFDELVILTGLPQADAMALLEQLVEQGILG